MTKKTSRTDKSFPGGGRGSAFFEKSLLASMGEILQIFQAGLAAVDPFRVVAANVKLERGRFIAGPHVFDLDRFRNILVVGAGKAAAGMGEAVEAVLNNRISAGLLIMPQGLRATLRRVARAEGGHPFPDEAGRRASRKILEMLGGADEKTLVLCLISGGASALLAIPAAGLTLADKRAVTSLLIRSGAAIGELNAVRKHLSAVKGGRLARAAFPATILTMILSDVIGDRFDVIGSGPTAPDASNFADAWSVIEKYGLQDKIPVRARKYLERGLAGLESETVKKNDPCLARSAHLVVGSILTAIEGARKKARSMGIAVEIITRALQGEARAAASFLAAKAMRIQSGLAPGRKFCLLCGGETTVSVRGSGRGGRNQELALAFALAVAGRQGIELLSAGTDGIDGPTDAAGAIVDGATVAKAAGLGLDARAFLDNNDSYSFFSELDRLSGGRHHLKTGPSGTNVMDLQIILIERSAFPLPAI